MVTRNMHIGFIRNIQFTKLLKADGRLREFNFRKLPARSEVEVFTVDVCDNRGNRIMFRMQKEGAQWKIVPQPLPEWIWEGETSLNDLIEKEG